MVARVKIAEFGIIQKALANAVVTFYVANSDGSSTGTKAILYQESTGTAARENPQTLDENGKLSQACFVEASVVAAITGINDRTARLIKKIRQNPLEFQLPITGASFNYLSALALYGDLAAIEAAVSDVEAVLSDAGFIAVSNDLTGDDNIGIVANNIGSINTVAGIASDVSTVAGIDSEIAALSAAASGISILSPIAADITSVASVASDVTEVSNISTDVTTVSDNIASVIAAANLIDSSNLLDITNPLSLNVAQAAIGDGTSNPASDFYDSLAALQVDYPLAIGTWQEMDALAFQKASAGNNNVLIKNGTYMINFPLSLTTKVFSIYGEGKPVIKGNAAPHTGTAQSSGSSTTVTLKADASSFDDYYNNWEIYISSGTGAGQFRTVSDYNGTTKIATVSSVWSTQPDETSVYSIVPTYMIVLNDCVPTIRDLKLDGDHKFRTVLYHTLDALVDYRDLELDRGGVDEIPVSNFSALMWFNAGNDGVSGVCNDIVFKDIKANGNDSTAFGSAAGSGRHLLFSGSNFSLNLYMNSPRFLMGNSDSREHDSININTGCSSGYLIVDNIYMEHNHLSRRDIKLHDGSAVFNGGRLVQSSNFVASTPIGGDSDTEVGDKCNDCVAYTTGGSYGGELILNNLIIDARCFPLGVTGSSGNSNSRVIMDGCSSFGPTESISRYNIETDSNQQANWIGFRDGGASEASGVRNSTFYDGHYPIQLIGNNGFAHNNTIDNPIIYGVWAQMFSDKGISIVDNEIITRTTGRLTSQNEVLRVEGNAAATIEVRGNTLKRDGNVSLIDFFIDVENDYTGFIEDNDFDEFITSGYAQGASSNTITLQNSSSSSSIDNDYATGHVIITGGVGVGQSKLINSYNGSTKVATVSGTWGTQPATVTGTAQAGAASTITLAAGASATDDLFNGGYITITSGTGAGQSKVVTDYNGTTKVLTISGSWSTQPDATSVYAINSAYEIRNFDSCVNLGASTNKTIIRNNNGFNQVIDVTSTTYTVGNVCNDNVVKLTNAGAITVTLPKNIQKGWSTQLVQGGPGIISLSAESGASISGLSDYYKTYGEGDIIEIMVIDNEDGVSSEYLVKTVFAKTGTLTDSATINWDVSSAEQAEVTLGANRTMAAPTNLIAGRSYTLFIIQDGTGSRTITWNAIFKWPGGVAPTLSTGAGDIDIINFIYDGTSLYGVAQTDFS